MARKPLPESEVTARIEYAKNHTPIEFAQEFGMKLSSAAVFYSKNHIKVRKVINYDETVEYIKEHSCRESAEHFNCTEGQIAKIANAAGVRYKSAWKYKTGDRNKMIAILCKDFTYEAIARVFDMTAQRVAQIYKEYLNEEKENPS